MSSSPRPSCRENSLRCAAVTGKVCSCDACFGARKERTRGLVTQQPPHCLLSSTPAPSSVWRCTQVCVTQKAAKAAGPPCWLQPPPASASCRALVYELHRLSPRDRAITLVTGTPDTFFTNIKTSVDLTSIRLISTVVRLLWLMWVDAWRDRTV